MEAPLRAVHDLSDRSTLEFAETTPQGDQALALELVDEQRHKPRLAIGAVAETKPASSAR